MNFCLTHNVPTEFPLGNIHGCLVVSCPPSEMDMSDEWVDSLPVPDEEELLLMDMNAEVLEADFVGE